MKIGTSLYILLAGVVLGLILAIVFLVPSARPPSQIGGVFPSAPEDSGAVPASPTVTSSPSASGTVIPPVPPPNVIPAPIRAFPPPKPHVELGDAVHVPNLPIPTNQP